MSDFSDLDALVVDLTAAPDAARPFIRRVMQEKCEDIRDEARDEAARTGLASYAASIGYTTRESASSVDGEVGPTPGRRQGSFGFVEEGGSRVKSAPQHALRGALEHNVADAVDKLQSAAHDGLEKAVGG